MDLVSIIICTFKGENKLERAVRSVLNQTYKDIEVIVVDDNGEGTEAGLRTNQLMKKYEKDKRVLYLKHKENCNGAVARNTGIKHANGKYIAFLDDDDWFFPTRVSECVNALENNVDADAVYTGVVYTRDEKVVGIMQPKYEGVLLRELLLDFSLIGTGSNLFLTKKAVLALHGFDETYVRHQDVEFFLRFFGKFSIKKIESILVAKGTNGTDNIPAYFKLESTKNKLSECFSKQIACLGEEKEKYFYKQYQELYISALRQKDKALLEKAEKNLLTYGKFTMKDRVRKFLWRFGIYNNIFYNKLLEIYYSIRDIIYRKSLSEKDLKFVLENMK